MEIYLNPGNDGFLTAVRSKIYVDKTRLIAHTNEVLGTEQKLASVLRNSDELLEATLNQDEEAVAKGIE